MLKNHVLDNGLNVSTVNMPHMESVSLGIWIRTGARNELKETNGISHLLEHLLFKGTKKRDAEQLKHDIEGRGGSFNGFTSEEFTCYLVKVLAKDVGLGMDVLSDMVLNPLLKKDDIEKEKSIIIEEINMYKDMPTHYVHELLTEILWPGHPLGFPLAGTVESVGSLRRQTIVDYKEAYYNPQNMAVSAVGRLKENDILKLSRRYLSKAPNAETSTYERPYKLQTKPELILSSKDTEQTHLAIGLHAIDRFHPDRYTLNLLNIILGANMSSRLFHEVREKRALCYEIGSSVRRYHDAGAFVISAGVDHGKLIKALKVIVDELAKVKKSPVGASELKRAKEYYKGQLLLTLEDTMSSMLWFGEKVITGEKNFDVKKILDKVDSIGARDLMKLANNIFDNANLNLAVIGPIKDKGTIEEVLQI